ncbi:MAG: PqiC family protein [Agarilytica sp.]
MNKLRKYIQRYAFLGGLSILTACASSGPATSFYTLYSDTNIAAVKEETAKISIGIGPIVLPDYLENPSVVTQSNSNKLSVLGYHAWAGSLNEAMSRVLADDVSSALNLDSVWSFPWDNRIRPQYQIRVVVDQFDGKRGGEVSLRVKWTLLNEAGDKLLALRKVEMKKNTGTKSVEDYVATMNALLNELSVTIVNELVEAEVTKNNGAYRF